MIRNILMSMIENIDNISYRYRLKESAGVIGTVVLVEDSYLAVIYTYASKLLNTYSAEFVFYEEALAWFEETYLHAESSLTALKSLRDFVADDLYSCEKSSDYIDVLWCTNVETSETVAVSFKEPMPSWMHCSNTSLASLFFSDVKLLGGSVN